MTMMLRPCLSEVLETSVISPLFVDVYFNWFEMTIIYLGSWTTHGFSFGDVVLFWYC